ASGSVESVATILQLHHNFIAPNLNCEDLHPEIEALVHSSRIPQQMIQVPLEITIKASFGFGDVNACVVFKKYH
ncbi:MAG: beta-ketoacyl-[acyl-carrier-protein] synthase family protein, partial [Flavobacterium sp.]